MYIISRTCMHTNRLHGTFYEPCSQKREKEHKKYVVRIIPPDKKSDAKTYEWHNVHESFLSPTELKGKLMYI